MSHPMPRVGPSNSSTLVAMNNLARNQRAMATAMERLATGKRINRTSDDPAGAAAAAGLARRRITLEEVVKQAEYGQHMLNAADGALGQVQDLLLGLQGLVVQTAQTGGRSPAEREASQAEASSILQAIDYLVANTTFGGKKILSEAIGFMSGDTWIAVPTLAGVQLGTVYQTVDTPPPPREPGQPPAPPPRPATITLGIEDIGDGGGLNLIDGDHELAQRSVENAIKQVATMRAQIGTLSRYTLGAKTNVDRAELESTAAAESKIMDADFAVEVSNLVRAQTLAQASLTVIQMTQRNEQNALALLR